MNTEDPFYKKRFSLTSKEEQENAGILSKDTSNPADFEEQVLSKFKEKQTLEQVLLDFKEKQALANSVLNVPRNEYVSGLDYPIERPISRWSEVVNEKSIEYLDENEIENFYKENISDPKKELQFNLILKKLKNSSNKLTISKEYSINELEKLITFISEGISDKELYIVSRIYDTNISFNFDLSLDKVDLKKIVDIPLFEKALSIIKQTSEEKGDSNFHDMTCCYRIIQDFGPGFAEKIISGIEKVHFLKKDPRFKKSIYYMHDPWSQISYDPYIFEEIDKLNEIDFETTANFCQKICSLSGRDNNISLNEFVYLSKLFRDKAQSLNNITIDEDFLEKNNLIHKGISEIALHLSYQPKDSQLPGSSIEDYRRFKNAEKEYVSEQMVFLEDLAKRFNIKNDFNNLTRMGGSYLLESLHSAVCPLRFLTNQPDFVKFINNNFEVKDLDDLARITKNILENRIDTSYESQLESVKNLQTIVGRDKDKIERLFLLDNEYKPGFINWLADLYEKTGYDILDAVQEHGYAQSKLESLQLWYNDKSTFDKALSLGILGKNNDDFSGEYTSSLYRHDLLLELTKDPEVFEFANHNKDIDLFKVAIKSSGSIIKYWYDNQEIFEKAKARGLFAKKDRYSRSNLEKTKEVSEIIGNQLLLDFSDANPEFNIIQIAVNEFDSSKIIKSIKNWAQAWQSGAQEFKVAQSIGLFNDLSERNITKYNELAILYQIEDKDITQFKKIYDLDIGKRLFRGDDLKKLVETPSKKRWDYIEVVSKIDKSPSQEMQRIKESLISQILGTEDPIARYGDIENIFIKNNLPLVGKIFNIFKALHTPEIMNDQLSAGYLSPALKSFSNRKRYQTIFNDLLKIHVESSNRNLHEFLETISKGQDLIEICETKGVEALKPEQLEYLQFVLKRMNVVYDNSLKALLNKGQDEFKKDDGIDVAEEIKNLRSNLGITNKQSISKRLVDMFARPLGYSSIEQILIRMNEAKIKTDLRNRRLVQSLDGFKLKDYDLMKGVGEEYIEKILQNGSVAKEYLGQLADSDSTPFDTDVAMIDPANGENRFDLAYRTASGYGGLIFVIKDRGQFQITIPKQKEITTDKMELFKTGRVNNSHYGIRTGFPTTEVDYMIASKNLTDNKSQLEKIFINLAQNGYYIPVIDGEKKLLLTPEKFDQYKKIFAGIDLFSSEPLVVALPQPDSAYDKLVKTMIVNKEKSAENNKNATTKVNEVIVGALRDCQIGLKNKFETSIVGAEIFDTGSTARNTDNPNSGIDFDLIVRIDESDEPKAIAAATEIKNRLKFSKDLRPNGDKDGLPQIRLSGVEGITKNPVDIDVCFVKKSELVNFGSHNAVEQKLQWINNNLGEEYYQNVIANIALAKQILKKGGAYKKIEQGGIGGIGVENWILSNKGNFLEAAKNFLNAARNGNGNIDLKEFEKKYQIIDPGNNLFKPGHENFTEHLTRSGYEAMIKVCEEVVTTYG